MGPLAEGKLEMVSMQADPSGDRWQCLVAVELEGRHTGYSVTVTRNDLERWGHGKEPKDIKELVIRSFEFLLEREPAAAILRSFELSVIPRYFPEYNQIFANS